MTTAENTAGPVAIAPLHRAELVEVGRTELPDVEAIVSERRNHSDTWFLLLREVEPAVSL